MSDSTTQKKSNKVAASVASSAKEEASKDDALSAFERELQKKIRNKIKKLEKIQELETKIKRKEIVANEEQLGKVAGKAGVQAEIDDVKSYLTMYTASQKEQGGGEAALKRQHAKELYKSKEQAVRCVANMMVMHTMMESGQKIPEELEEGVKHFSEQVSTLIGQGVSSSLNWRKERQVFIDSCKKLVGSSKDVIEHTDISYEDFATGIAESISSNDFPETLERKHTHEAPTAAEAEPEQEDEPEEEEEEVVPEVVEEPVEEPKQEAPKVEEAQPVAEKKPDESETTPAATEDSPVAEGEETRGGRGRGRGPRPDRGTRGDRGAIRGERGAYRGDRGAYRGDRGAYRGDRGDRGTRGRGRGQNWRGRNGEDNEGFITVKEDGDKDTRGRGRGGYRGRGDRGDRGNRGAWRGNNEAGEGNFRGGPRPPRGDRPPRTRANNTGGDLPGVATAVADPKPAAAEEL